MTKLTDLEIGRLIAKRVNILSLTKIEYSDIIDECLDEDNTQGLQKMADGMGLEELIDRETLHRFYFLAVTSGAIHQKELLTGEE